MKNRLLYLKVFVGALLFSTAAEAQYCATEYDEGCNVGDDINDFVLTGSGIEHYGTGCSVDSYHDYTGDLALLGSLQATVAYDLTVGHSYITNEYVTIWIDFNNDFQFDNLTEMVFQSTSGSVDYLTTGSVSIPSVAPVNGVRMRVIVSYDDLPSGACGYIEYYGETHDYLVNILPAPPCPYPIDLHVINSAPTSAILGWTAQGTPVEYLVEWGMPGFTPGTGAEIGADIVTATTYEVTALTTGESYEFYVQADCDVDGFSTWVGPLTFITAPCVASTTLPWTEDFESFTDIGMYTYPGCWSQENMGGTNGWNVHNNAYAGTDADANSGSNFLAIEALSNANIWTPSFELVAGERYQFMFNWAGDYGDGWAAEVLVNSSPTSVGATVLDVLLEEGWWTEPYYYEGMYCFTAPTSGTFSFGIHVKEFYGNDYLSFDDFSLTHIPGTAGTSLVYDVCSAEDEIDLDVLAAITESGYWDYPANSSALNWPSTLDVSLIPQTSQATYTPDGCFEEVTVDIIVNELSSAGNDGVIEACMNQQIDLLGALSGEVILGGTWYDEDDDALTSSYFKTGTTAGDYNYKYVAGNGVCPDDSAIVTLTILPCDYLTTEELTHATVAVYPNPSTGIFNITPAAEFEDYHFVVTDLNGRIIMTSSQESAQNGIVNVDLSDSQNGVYMIRVFNETQSTVIRLIKQ